MNNKSLVLYEKYEQLIYDTVDHRKSKRIPEKKSITASLTMLKPLTVWITTNCGKFLKRWEYHTT